MSNNDLEHREILSAKISKRSAEGFCHGNGISLTAMIEVAGLQLADEQVPPRIEARVEMVKQAREIDIERRSRRRK
jgi:hypothetical protein